jgi:hypothetical protein
VRVAVTAGVALYSAWSIPAWLGYYGIRFPTRAAGWLKAPLAAASGFFPMLLFTMSPGLFCKSRGRTPPHGAYLFLLRALQA